MRALTVRKYAKPDVYQLIQVSVPTIKAPDEVLIQMHAVRLFTGDTQTAAGSFKFITKTSFPLILGRTGSGVVTAVGSGVQSLRVGDAVYGMGLKNPMTKYFADGAAGWCAEYAVTTVDLLLVKPSQLSFEQAASDLSSLVTATQFTRTCMNLNPKAFSDQTLEETAMVVAAGLRASTSIAAQYAKNVMGAKKVITTESTVKVSLLDKLLPDVFDQVVDDQT